MAILRVRDADGNIIEIPVIRGEDGADGYTPVKGVDYFTEEDKAEFVEQVLSNFTDASEVAL